MTKYKVVMTDSNFPSMDITENILKEKLNVEFEVFQCRDQDEIIEVTKDADAIITQFSQIDTSVIRNLKKCKVIVSTGIGTNQIDVEAASDKNIHVANILDYCEEEVASHTIALLLTISRKIINYNDDIKNKEIWDLYMQTPIKRYSNSIFGIIGLGKIGKMVAERSKPFNFEIIAYDPYVNKEEAKKIGVKLVEFKKILSQSDFICINAPLTPETRNLFGKNQFKAMKKSAMLINAARGEMICEDELYIALKSGEIAGAALDVLVNEPPNFKDNQLLHLDNTVITPHVAWHSEDSFNELHSKIGHTIVSVLKGGDPLYSVNSL